MEKQDKFSEFMDWMKNQPDRTMVSAVIIRLWNKFEEKQQNKK